MGQIGPATPKSAGRRRGKAQATKMTPAVIEREALREWSPEQIAGRLAMTDLS